MAPPPLGSDIEGAFITSLLLESVGSPPLEFSRAILDLLKSRPFQVKYRKEIVLGQLDKIELITADWLTSGVLHQKK
jgi:hypothetical protein